jgi:hypothetical protein
VSGREVDAAVERIVRSFDAMEPLRDPSRDYPGHWNPDPWSHRRGDLDDWTERKIHGHLAPGRYLAVVERPPGLDDLGLEVEWIAGRHLVLGILADEDLVE